MWLGLIQSFEGHTEQKGEEKSFTPFCPAIALELGHLISSSFVLGLGFTPSAPLVLRPSDSD